MDLSYYGARYYDARTSVWLGVDPKAGKAPNESPYVYCSNNPIKFVDPDGKFKTWFGAAVYSLFHGGKVGTSTNGEHFVSMPNQGGTVSEPGMLSGVDVSEQRIFDRRGRNTPNMPASQASERPTLNAQKDDQSHYNEKSYQTRQEGAKFEQAKSDLLNSDAVSFGSPETGLGGVQTLGEGLKAMAVPFILQAAGVPAVLPTLAKGIEKLDKVLTYPQAIQNFNEQYKESRNSSKNATKNE